MRQHKLLFLLLLISPIIYGQKVKTDSLKNKLPYQKYKGLKVVYISLSPNITYTTGSRVFTFDLRSAPRYGYYISPKLQILGEYALTFLTFRRSPQNETKLYHQFAMTGRYFPLKKHNYFFLETGLQTGNYTAKKPDRTLIDTWSTNYIIGIGVETLPKKRKYVLMYDYRWVIPFNKKYIFDVVKSIGLGVTIRKK